MWFLATGAQDRAVTLPLSLTMTDRHRRRAPGLFSSRFDLGLSSYLLWDLRWDLLWDLRDD
jgi:hypothetical protein